MRSSNGNFEATSSRHAAGDPGGASDRALAARLKARALELGFERAGIARLGPSAHADFYRAWLAAGRHGDMAYLARPDAVARRADPTASPAGLPELRSALVVAHHYFPGDEVEAHARDPARGVVARYARGRDYHRVLKGKLLELLRWLEREVGRALPAARASVDTAPVLERELAQRAGLGWFGRNTMLIDPRAGSWFFLGTLLLELELEPDPPFLEDRCGTCRACLDACPTGALLGRDDAGAPIIDARRCISYLTIELRGPIPRELRPLIGNRVFGCDDCQDVCPWNGPKFVRLTREAGYLARASRASQQSESESSGEAAESESGRSGRPGPLQPSENPDSDSGATRLDSDSDSGLAASASRAAAWIPGTSGPALLDLMAMDEAAWDEFSRGSAIRRARRAGFLRNVAVALGNWGSPEAVPALVRALSDPEPLVRGHVAWALGRIGTGEARAALEVRAAVEPDTYVREEIEAADVG